MQAFINFNEQKGIRMPKGQEKYEVLCKIITDDFIVCESSRYTDEVKLIKTFG